MKKQQQQQILEEFVKIFHNKKEPKQQDKTNDQKSTNEWECDSHFVLQEVQVIRVRRLNPDATASWVKVTLGCHRKPSCS